MFAIAARRMGYRVHTYSPDCDSPTGQVSDVEVQGPYQDIDAVRAFARNVDVVTFEFENVPVEAAEAAAALVPVRPAGRVLHVAQNRLREKSFLQKNGFPVTPFAPVRTPAELPEALRICGLPAVLKTAGWGYDGKGQAKVQHAGQAGAMLAELGSQEAILESFIDFEAEISVIGARGLDGKMMVYPAIQNHHERHILDHSCCPARVAPKVALAAEEICRGVLESLDVVGVLCVEYFVRQDGSLLINELAPRPHNSGHLTIDAFMTCQFEQQLRAICGLSLGETFIWRPAAMANLLGDLWSRGEPRWARACAFRDVKLHLYGKSVPRPGRKMGHLTAFAETSGLALERVRAARGALVNGVSTASGRADF
jgi:5-(carboxyamino)imidazole ribonucleotide synthase